MITILTEIDGDGTILSSVIEDKTLTGHFATTHKHLAEWDGEKYVVPGNNPGILKRIFKDVKRLNLQRRGMYYYRIEDSKPPKHDNTTS